MNKKQKQIRLQHLKDLKKFRSLFNNSHFVKKNIQDMINIEKKSFLNKFNIASIGTLASI